MQGHRRYTPAVCKPRHVALLWWICLAPIAGSGCHHHPSTKPAPQLHTTQAAYEYIENYQRALYGGIPPDATVEPPAFSFKRSNDSFIFGLCPEVLLSAIEHAEEPLPTRFTNRALLVSFRLVVPFVRASVEDVDAVISRPLRSIGVHEGPLAATLPLPTIQAVAVPLPVGERDYFIALSEGSGLWTHRLARISLRLVSADGSARMPLADTSSNNYRARLERMPELRVAATASILDIARGGPACETLPPPLPIDPDADRASCELTIAMQLFVISHEYAHTLLGHRRGAAPPRTKERISADDTDDAALALLPRFGNSWREEIEADYIGTLLFLFAIDNMATDNVIMVPVRHRTWIAAPLIFLYLATFAESAHSAAAGYFDPHMTSPDERESARQYAADVVTSLHGRCDADLRLPPLPQSYPTADARSKAVSMAIQTYLKHRQRLPNMSEEERANVRRSVELASRVNDLLRDITDEVNSGVPLVHLHLLWKENQ